MYGNNYEKQCFQKELFRNPPSDCSVVYTWIWNAPITKDGIKKQLEEFSAAGIKGIYVIAEPENFRPEKKKTYLSPDYLTDEFMQRIAYAYECANETNILLWLYDEGGFPSGGACGLVQKHNKEATMKILNKRENTLKAGDKYIPCESVVAAFCSDVKITSGFTSLKDEAIDEYIVVDFVHGPNMVDITNPSVTETFIELTHERYKEFLGKNFGSSINMMFTDEPFLPRQMWGENFAQDFIHEYGYDITDFVDCICDEEKAKTTLQKKARIDYGRFLGKKLKANFFEKIASWCEENSLKLCGHVNYDDTPQGSVEGGYFSILDILRCFHIPGVDAIWRQIFPNGNYIEENMSTFYPRLASSAASQRGGGLALSESMAAYGDGVTFDEMRYVLNYQLVRGINIFNMMILSYGKTRALALGLRPCFSPVKPGFYNLRHFNEYFARASYVMRLGKSACDTALYFPANDLWAGGETAKSAQSSYNKTGEYLEKKHIDFDIIDDEGVRSCKVTENGLLIGNAVYKHICLPQTQMIPNDVYEKIKPYIGEGKPYLKCDNEKIRIKCRKISDSEEIYIIFNESSKTENVCVEFNEYDRLYRLELESGRITRAIKENFNLLYGEVAVFIRTNQNIECDKEKFEQVAHLTNFKITQSKRFVITEDGIESQITDNTNWTKDFSGEITYEFSYIIEEVDENSQYMIELKNTRYSAAVFVNGYNAGTCGMSPMCVYFPGKYLKKEGVISVIVSNTAANEILSKENVITSWDKSEMGGYHQRTRIFEKDNLCAEIGEVLIYKISD